MMYNRYPLLTSPLQIGSTVLKSRMTASPSQPDLGQGPENYPSSAVMTLMANRAKSGASIVTCSGMLPHREVMDETEHFEHYDINVPGVQNYLSQLSEAIHLYGAKASMVLGCGMLEGYDVVGGIEGFSVEGDGSRGLIGKELTPDLMDKMANDYAEQAFLLKQCGFDMVFFHCAYRAYLPSRFLSALTNTRKDEFGGSIKNRAKFPLMICERIKQKCGKDFLIEASISAVEPEGGNTLLDTIEFANMAEGLIDIIQVRGGEIDPSHVIPFSPDRTPFLHHAEAIKKSGTKVKIATINGFHDPDEAEAALAEGKADLIAMARSWICDPEYGQKIYEGRPEDIVPCLRCNKCHISSWNDPYISTCAVNPRWGFEDKLDALITPPGRSEKVAVIGGGPAGMEAAIIATQRGHKVTLFEKDHRLGGLINHSENVGFKWTLRDFRDYMVRQTVKSGCEIRLGTEATPEMIKAGGYDRVIVAIGGKQFKPDIPGIDGENVSFAVDSFYHPEKLGERVVIIGGGEIGVEAGIHLARLGRKVTVIAAHDKLAEDATPVHYRVMFRDVWENQEGFGYVLNSRCNGIHDGYVTYKSEDGQEHRLDCDSVLVAAGMRPRTEETLPFYGTAGYTSVIGDCSKVANVQKAMRSAYITASF